MVDISTTAGLNEHIDSIQSDLIQKRKLKILLFKRFLRCNIIQEKDLIFICQQAHSGRLVYNKDSKNCNPSLILMFPLLEYPILIINLIIELIYYLTRGLR